MYIPLALTHYFPSITFIILILICPKFMPAKKTEKEKVVKAKPAKTEAKPAKKAEADKKPATKKLGKETTASKTEDTSKVLKADELFG